MAVIERAVSYSSNQANPDSFAQTLLLARAYFANLLSWLYFEKVSTKYIHPGQTQTEQKPPRYFLLDYNGVNCFDTLIK